MFLLKYLAIAVGCLPLRNQRKRSFTSSYIPSSVDIYAWQIGMCCLFSKSCQVEVEKHPPPVASWLFLVGWSTAAPKIGATRAACCPLCSQSLKCWKYWKYWKYFLSFLPPLRHRATHHTPQQTSTPVFLRCPPSTAAARIITAPRRARRRPTGPTASWVSAGGRCACCPGLPRSLLPLLSAPGRCAGAGEPKSKIASWGGSGS